MNKRNGRADAAGIFPPAVPIMNLIGAVSFRQYDEYELRHCYAIVEVIAGLTVPANKAATIQNAFAA